MKRIFFILILLFTYFNNFAYEFAYDASNVIEQNHAIYHLSYPLSQYNNDHLCGIRAKQSSKYPIRVPSSYEFGHYFRQQHYAEKDIFTFHVLYQYDAFIEFIKTLPGYEQYVKKLHKKISTMAWYKKCIGNIKGKHYWGFTDRVKQLHADVQHEKRIHKKEQLSHISFSKNSDIPHFSCEQVIIHALNTSDNQFILANQLDFLMQDLFDNALMHNISVHTDLEICIEATINTIRYATNPYQCAFNAAFINHIAYEIEDRIAKNDLKITQKKQNMNLFSRALEQFITRLNPVTQIKNSCEFLVDAACFIADITLGKLYLTKEQYQLRKDNFWSTIDSLSPSKLKLLSNEQLVDLVAHCAADCVFSFGIFKVANYVKNMQRISKINQRISTITQQLTHVVDGALNEKPILITSEGVIIGSAENMQQAGILAQEVIRDSRMLLESIEKGLLASIKPELNELNHIFDEIHGVGPLASKKIRPNCNHMLGIEFNWTKKGTFDLNGFHHDLNACVENTHIFNFKNKILTKDGFYKTDIFYQGKLVKRDATFFPSNWSRKKVINQLYEGYKNFINSGKSFVLQRNGKWQADIFIGNTKVRIIIKNSGVMQTAYPIIN